MIKVIASDITDEVEQMALVMSRARTSPYTCQNLVKCCIDMIGILLCNRGNPLGC